MPRDGPADARSLLIVSSDCPGAGGSCTSGVQGAKLADQAFRRSAVGVPVRYGHRHALGAYGFSGPRCATDENVDLKRNVHRVGPPLPDNRGCDELAPAVVPDAGPQRPTTRRC